ncbi:MAG: ATP-binding protein [Desulfobacterales bacterium]
MKILLIDDDRVFLKFLTHRLEEAGHEVISAADGLSALHLLTDVTPDIIFLDLILPKIDGDQLCRIIRKMVHLNNCRLVVVSAVVAEMGSDYDAIGADDYIAKGPFANIARHVLDILKSASDPATAAPSRHVLGLDQVSPRQLTRELLSRNHHLQTILESMEEGIIEIVEEAVVYANAAAVRLFTLPLEKILAASPQRLFEAGQRARIGELLGAEGTRMTEIGENNPIDLGGRLVTVKSFRVDHDAQCRIMLITDITERKRLEIQLQHAQKMEAIGTIASGVAHNFRNTLTGILVNSQLIQENYPDDPELLEIVGRIGTAVKKGAHLIERLMQFSRKEIAREFKKVDLVTIVAGIYQIVRKSFNEKIEIRLNLHQSLPITGDQAGLGLVLMNLFSNARDAMPTGGIIQIDARRVGAMAVVRVSDNGEGMDAETAKRCFDPFYTTKEVGKGTGLGLSTSYGIIRGHDGNISVDSAPQKGATFTLRLPLAGGTAGGGRKNQHDIVTGRGQRVLVFEPSAKEKAILRDVLECIGFRPVMVSAADDLPGQYATEKPPAVLLDLDPTDLNETGCIDRILSLDPMARIALFRNGPLSATNQGTVINDERIAGYLETPLDVAELSQLLARMLRDQPEPGTIF